MMWLFEARKRYGLTILNYVATSNHIHLLVYADGDRTTIPRAMQLLAGRVAQEFNHRKNRGGAFWEDRYHATAVESGHHLRRCMVYIDLNMVRAGAVRQPGDWECSGYREIQNPPLRYQRIDQTTLAHLLELPTVEDLRIWQQRVVRESLDSLAKQPRCPEWTESVAVGSELYLQSIKEELAMVARHRAIQAIDSDASMLREAPGAYITGNADTNATLRHQNSIDWNLSY